MQTVALWLLVTLNSDIPPVVERFPTREACESVREAMRQQEADHYNDGKKTQANAHRLRCIPATVVR